MQLDKSWHNYNESLIERGRILMDMELLKSWKKEITRMNQRKVEAPVIFMFLPSLRLDLEFFLGWFKE
jgi:hypothetical protein